jgi:DNA transformation protein and related proteins
MFVAEYTTINTLFFQPCLWVHMSNDEALSWFTEKCGVPVKPRKMFGGVGVFSDDVMFALIHGGVVYMKSTSEMAGKYMDDGYRFEPPFRKGIKMPYWYVPEMLEDDKLQEWTVESLEHARASKR